ATFEAPKHQKKVAEIKSDVEALLEGGKKRQPPEKYWYYGDKEVKGQEQDPWWAKLYTVNWLGKLPPKAVEAESKPTTKETVLTRDTPLNDVLQVIALVYHSSQTGSSGCSVRYKPTAGVTPPVHTSGGVGDVISGASGSPGIGQAGQRGS